MKNKLFSKSPTILCVLFVVSLFFLHACKKDLFISGAQGILSVREAKDFFSNQILPNSPLTLKAKSTNNPDLSKINHLLYKEPLWEEAREEKVDDGVALAIPIKFLYKNHLILGPNTKINFEELNYLLIKKDNAGKMHANWITKIPNKEYVNNNKLGFIGHTVVQDWDGNFEKDFLYEKNGRITEYQKVEKVSQNKNQMFTKTGGSWINLTQKVSLSNTMSEIDSDITAIDTTGIKTPADTLATSLPVYAIANIKYQDINGNCWVNLAQIGYSSPDGGGVTLYRMQVDCGNTSSGGGGGTSTSTGLIMPPPPETPIANMKEYLKCFDKSKPASLTVYAQTTASSFPGHTFISIKQGDNIMTFGFYPKSGFPANLSGPGVMGDDSGHSYTVATNYGDISAKQLKSIIDIFVAYSATNYNLATNNCANPVFDALNIIGVTNSSGVTMPDALYNLISPLSSSKNGNAPKTKRTCN